MSKFENMWHLMANYNFEIDGDVPVGVTCALCSKLMIDPYASECGCQFCFGCIKKYLSGSNKKCPVCSNGCSEEVLIIDTNVFKDVRTNHMIKKVSVKCANDYCLFSTELEKMEKHIRECTTKNDPCPFHSLGCITMDMNECSIDEHLQKNMPSHSNILINVINNQKRDINELRQRMELKDLEIKELKEVLAQFKKEIDYFKGILETLVKNQFDDLGDKYNLNDSCSSLYAGNSRDAEETEKVLQGGQIKQKIPQIENLKMDNEISVQYLPMPETSSCNSIVEPTINSDVLKEIHKPIEIFKWTIDNFARKINERTSRPLFYSDPFYANKYKFCLCARIIEVPTMKDTLYLELYLAIMKGDQDDVVSWPMKHGIEISVLNQYHMAVHSCGCYSYDKHKGHKYNFDKPLKDMNDCIGGLSISIKSIRNTSGLLVKDCILVHCSIIDPLI